MLRFTVFLCIAVFAIGAEKENGKKRVCVIGAGAAGLCALRHLAADLDYFAPTAFEQSNDVGGTWLYSDKTGTDEHGSRYHSSMYKNLRTNKPLIVMNFPDYATMGSNGDGVATGSHEQVLEYLMDYTEHFKIRQYIKFNTRVESVRPIVNKEDWRQTTWKVRVRNLQTNLTEERDFDAIIICNGHYSEPNIPNIPGIETFTGDIIHSHDYRKPEKYSGKNVIVLGAGVSGRDIGVELTAYANHVYLSHNHDRIGGYMPNNMDQIAGVKSVSESDFVLRDGKIVTADSFIYCTGYKIEFPFLDKTCKIRVNRNNVTPLYKHLVNVVHPSMSIIGVLPNASSLSFFHIQVQFHLALLKGRINLPTEPDVIKPDYTIFDNIDDLADYGGFERLPSYYKNGILAWDDAFGNHLLSKYFKNSTFNIAPNNQRITIVTREMSCKDLPDSLESSKYIPLFQRYYNSIV